MPDKHPLVPGQTALRGKSEHKKKHAGHAIHRAGVQSQAEHDAVAKGTAASHVQSHKAPHSLPKKG
jgi:hypothetical protein